MDKTIVTAELPAGAVEFCIIYSLDDSVRIIGSGDAFDALALAKRFVAQWEAQHGAIADRAPVD